VKTSERPPAEADTLDPQPKEVDEMAASLVIEEEWGTCKGWVHSHNGYYAGDFSTTSRDDETRDR
jgi:hypothetical protein